MPMNLKILNPDTTIVDRSVDYVQLTMKSGAIGILSGHTPFAGEIVKSYIKFSFDGKEEKVPLEGGYAVVMPDNVKVFAAEKY